MLPGLPRAARPSGRFAEGAWPRAAHAKGSGRRVSRVFSWQKSVAISDWT